LMDEEVTSAREDDLASLTEQLEPLVGHVDTLIPLGDDGKPEAAWLEAYFRSGKWSAAMALEKAKIGLASGDPKIVELNHFTAISFLRLSHRMEIDHRKRIARRKGGNTRGAKQTKKAKKKYKPFQSLFLRLLSKGMNLGDARAIVHKELENKCIFVTDRTVRTHFVAPSAKEAQPGEQNDSVPDILAANDLDLLGSVWFEAAEPSARDGSRTADLVKGTGHLLETGDLDLDPIGGGLGDAAKSLEHADEMTELIRRMRRGDLHAHAWLEQYSLNLLRSGRWIAEGVRDGCANPEVIPADWLLLPVHIDFSDGTTITFNDAAYHKVVVRPATATKSVMEKYPDGRRANKGASAEAASNQRRKTCE
jgi:hypothetical protein